MLQDIETGKVKNYRDVEQEGVPEEDDYATSGTIHPHDREEVPPAEGERPAADSAAPPVTDDTLRESRRPSEVSEVPTILFLEFLYV